MGETAAAVKRNMYQNYPFRPSKEEDIDVGDWRKRPPVLHLRETFCPQSTSPLPPLRKKIMEIAERDKMIATDEMEIISTLNIKDQEDVVAEERRANKKSSDPIASTNHYIIPYRRKDNNDGGRGHSNVSSRSSSGIINCVLPTRYQPKIQFKNSMYPSFSKRNYRYSSSSQIQNWRKRTEPVVCPDNLFEYDQEGNIRNKYSVDEKMVIDVINKLISGENNKIFDTTLYPLNMASIFSRLVIRSPHSKCLMIYTKV